MTVVFQETIAAMATPPGRGGVAIIRVSGPQVPNLLLSLFKKSLTPRMASFVNFYSEQDVVLDKGIALYFSAPNSFTGEDILEFHAHGSPVNLDLILQSLFLRGIRLARPGEFSERAFLNGKLDLTQAEAIADLIDASSTQAARAALQTLEGEFSSFINDLLEKLTALRAYVEASLDFSEEEIDFLADHSIHEKVASLKETVEHILSQAKQGALLKEGMTIVLAGKPNAGKSSLLNVLSGKDLAIVTPVPGTTRDVLRQEIQLEGLPVHIIDTAGLRETMDPVELEGIRRAKLEMEKADAILWIQDSPSEKLDIETFSFCKQAKIIKVINKIDLLNENERVEKSSITSIYLSAKTKQGIQLLIQELKDCVSYEAGEGKFIARTRHILALKRAKSSLEKAFLNLNNKKHPELLAEELRLAQNALSEITGEFTTEDLLGRIFSSFCIGK